MRERPALDERYGGLSPHHPFHESSSHGPRTGPNMLRPRIQAPTFTGKNARRYRCRSQSARRFGRACS